MSVPPQNPSATRVAIVTGGSRGLGRSTVLKLAEKGISSIFTYVSNKAEAEKVVALAQQQGVKAVAVQLDTGKTAGFPNFVDRVHSELKSFGAERVHYLVNNAGTSHHALIVDTTEADFDLLYNVHLKGVFFLTQKLLPLMADGGRIVNISSGLARFSFPGSAPYASMKGAVEVLTRYLAKELGPRRISVNTVAPGAIETDFSGGMVRDNKQMNQQIAGMTALGRVGLPDDIGGMIATLLDDSNAWVNAQRIEASGGTLI